MQAQALRLDNGRIVTMTVKKLRRLATAQQDEFDEAIDRIRRNGMLLCVCTECGRASLVESYLGSLRCEACNQATVKCWGEVQFTPEQKKELDDGA